MNMDHLNQMAQSEIPADAVTVAAALHFGGEGAARVSKILTANYNAEFLSAVAVAFAKKADAKSSGDKALKNLGTTFRRAVPTEGEGKAKRKLCPALTLSVKQRKSVAGGGKQLTLAIVAAKAGKKVDVMTTRLREALKSAYALGDCGNLDILQPIYDLICALDDAGACGESETLMLTCMAVREELAVILDGLNGNAESESEAEETEEAQAA